MSLDIHVHAFTYIYSLIYIPACRPLTPKRSSQGNIDKYIAAGNVMENVAGVPYPSSSSLLLSSLELSDTKVYEP